ncbi:Homeodomain-like DNA binding domain-containing transcription factor [Phycomyces blakesleeanus NRRL 1555(-)]|uniref:Homeodomain-like DNA binding domain-containing transcription factor n=1 Tax=Phycomyces blakesleeanus (strain ATCC 8743b / DSM 1359 / FGSC 10004 / NBRC 33097 / NRRL 1555) TaxID=763407 RepID=A0A162TYC0_PHYB8|nr:Homeodomain-like DNA binding domain-containing transcription factor [Phycomyces blakesleeanus NRRL 1555(-)]OAD70813.1 Homeodomain-like DNA binding domain-containing transcription factor [Phycomyces blakesleeanus NRRL 1555(-)]|eukprot:XP_018288853.1 Homeodomain-like DNA binding domain-containing transcription factor [Phycomyces blakesleeanus NRRL 1555(-)]
METSSSSKTKRGSYYKADDLKYGGIMYLHLAEIGPTKISAIVQMKLSTVKKIIKRFQNTGSPLPGKSPDRPKIVNERKERHLVQIVRHVFWHDKFIRGGPNILFDKELERLTYESKDMQWSLGTQSPPLVLKLSRDHCALWLQKAF